MARRVEKIGTKRPRRMDRAPLAPHCFHILEELPSDLGLELAMLAHQVFLAACDPVDDGPLFVERVPDHVSERRRAAIVEAPADLLADLRALTGLQCFGPRSGPDVASACACVSEWARNAGHLRTAAILAEAGAAASPGDPQPAFIAGRANRILNEVWRSEVFYMRAIRLAYRCLKWDIYIRAHLGLGRLMADTGRRAAALKAYATAASVAETEGIEWLAAQTYHDLLVLHFDSGNLEEALAYACKAIRTYPVHNERFPLAVHDLAFVLLARGHAAEALPMLEAVIRAPLEADYQLLAMGTLARAAGQLGRREAVTAAEAMVLQAAPQHQFHAAFAMMNLAFGMRAIGEWERAARHVEQALSIAKATEVGYVLTHAPELLRQIRAGTPAPPPVPCPRKLLEDLESLIETLSNRVAAWHTAPSWNARWSAGQSGPRTLGAV